MARIKVLVCDDSALMRRSLRKIIESAPDLSVVGTARDGRDALDKARELKPDVITMDINMPVLDGITAMQAISYEGIAPVLMVSSLTQEGAETTFEAMALGAFDYVAKPGGTVSSNLDNVGREIVAKIRAAGRPGTLKRLLRKTGDGDSRQTKTTPVRKPNAISSGAGPGKGPGFKAVAIGISTGGPKTIFEVLPLLPKDMNAAVFMVQHMPGKFTTSFAERIDNRCALTCVEVSAGMMVEPGTVYLARGGYHLTLYHKLTQKVIIRTPTRPDHAFIPSVDVMMASVLEVFGSNTVGVLMTGMGDDGANGMVAIRETGGVTIAESKESAIVFGMPQEAIKRGGAEIVRPAWDIAAEIVNAVE